MRFDGDLISDLQARQAALGETNEQFAARLGVSRETWRMIQRGRTQITLRTLQGISTAFPELADAARAFFLPRDMR